MEFTRCYGCMRELEAPGAVCPHCGYDNTNDPLKQPSHVLPCGSVLNGQYMVGRSLGQGGFGITYVGYDLNLEIPVCIKEYYPEGSAVRSATQSRMVYWGTSENAQSMKESRKSFVKEAQKAVRLRDLSHVVTVWGVFYENETAYIVMDYIEGETLRDRLVRTQKPLGEKECIELLTPVMEDLEKAHGRGIIHRDIKPDNIMLTADGKPVLLDMGAAKDLGKSALNGGTPSSVMVVSQGFSPKEQYQSRGKIGPWTDVYAMCATICYCVSGKVPPAPMDRYGGEEADLSMFSPAVAAALAKGLALESGDRIQSMGELCAALNRAPEKPGKRKRNLPAQDDETKRDRKKQTEDKGNIKSETTGSPELKSKPAAPLPAPEHKKRKSKLPLFLIAAAVTVLAIFGVLKYVSSTTSPYGDFQDGLYYTIYRDHAELTKVRNKNSFNVEIPTEHKRKTLTAVGDKAFSDCSVLESVTFPKTVTSIGDEVFLNCDSLKEIHVKAGSYAAEYFRGDSRLVID